jgi:Escherichia/Staphylococcus phage prohead protease
MKIKQRVRLEIKEISAEGSFEGMLSPYENVDGGGDVVLPGAYTKTLKDQGPTRPLLWQHKTDQPIGSLTLEDRPEGLWCKGQLLMALADAQKAYLLIKSGIVKGLSIGFESIKDSIDAGVRQLKEIKLYEGSIVTFPMNEMALITAVKGRTGTKDDFNEELSDIQLEDAGYQMRSALMCALSSALWSGATRDEVLSMSETVIQQFSDAYMAYLPAFLDMLAQDGGYGMEMMERRRLEIKARMESWMPREIKAKTKKVDGADLPASCFAYVGDPDKTDTWKLPINFPGDEEKTKAHIRNALARFDQTQGIPEAERPKVLAKIHAAAKKYGIDVAKGGVALEEKAGRMISQANMDELNKACDHMKSAHDIVSALLDSGADDTATAKAAGVTPEAKAAEQKPEPVVDHSAATTLIGGIKALIRAA